jgi:hypothetical protein
MVFIRFFHKTVVKKQATNDWLGVANDCSGFPSIEESEGTDQTPGNATYPEASP